MLSSITTAQAPTPAGPYSQAIQAGSTLYFAGQIGLHPETGDLPSDFSRQAEQVFANLSAVAKAAGGSLSHIVKLTVYLTDFANFPLLNELMKSLFKAPYPARTTIQVVALPKEALVEIDAIMVLG